MRKNSLLFVMVCAMTVVLVAGRCSDDDETSTSQEAAPAASSDETKAADPGAAEPTVDAGVETDPLSGTMGDDSTDINAPLEDPADVPGGDTTLDDPTFEPEPVPEEAADL